MSASQSSALAGAALVPAAAAEAAAVSPIPGAAAATASTAATAAVEDPSLPPETPAAVVDLVDRLRREVADLREQVLVLGGASDGPLWFQSRRCPDCGVVAAGPLAAFCHMCGKGLPLPLESAEVSESGRRATFGLHPNALLSSEAEREVLKKVEASRQRQKKFNSMPISKAHKSDPNSAVILSLIPVQLPKSEMPPSEGLQKLKNGIRCVRYKPRAKPAVRDMYLLLDEQLGVGGALFWVEPGKKISLKATSHIRITDILCIIPGRYSDVLKDVPERSACCFSVIGLGTEFHAVVDNPELRDAVVQALVDAGTGVGHEITTLAPNAQIEGGDPASNSEPAAPGSEQQASRQQDGRALRSSLQESWRNSHHSVSKDLPRLWDKISVRVLGRSLLERGLRADDWERLRLPSWSRAEAGQPQHQPHQGGAAADDEQKADAPEGGEAEAAGPLPNRVWEGIYQVITAIAHVVEPSTARRAQIAADLRRIGASFVQGQDTEQLLNDFFEKQLGLDSPTMQTLQAVHQKMIFPAVKLLIGWAFESNPQPASAGGTPSVHQRLLLDARDAQDNWLVTLSFTETEAVVSHRRLAKSDPEPKNKVLAQWLLRWHLNIRFSPGVAGLAEGPSGVSLRAVSFEVPEAVSKKEKARLEALLRQSGGYVCFAQD